MDTKAITAEAREAAAQALTFIRIQIPQDRPGACGFAWINAYPVNKGNTKAGKAERKILEALGFTKDDYEKAFRLWNPSGYNGQDIDIKEYTAKAYCDVLNKHGIRAYVNSRLD